MFGAVNAGYIEVQLPDRFNPAVVTFKLTESGQEILRAVERTQPVRKSRKASLISFRGRDVWNCGARNIMHSRQAGAD
jgi:hypothetical protein